MKLTLFALVTLCLVAACRSAEAEYDYEEEAAAATPTPTKPTAAASAKPGKLGSLLSPRGRSASPLSARKSLVQATQTTVNAKITTTTEEPAEEAEEEYDEGVDEGAKSDASTMTTTTESPKNKIGRGGVVRPFRSNEDLLAALKRRRAQGIASSHHKEQSTTQPPAEQAQTKAKGQSSRASKSTGNANEVPKSTSRVRFGGARGKQAVAPAQEEAQESRPEDVQVKPKAFRRG